MLQAATTLPSATTTHGAEHPDTRSPSTARPVAQWTAADTLPPAQFNAKLDGQDATRYTAHNIALKPGDTLTLLGVPDLRAELESKQDTAAAAGAINPTRIRPDYREFAAVDYIQIGPNSLITPQ